MQKFFFVKLRKVLHVNPHLFYLMYTPTLNLPKCCILKRLNELRYKYFHFPSNPWPIFASSISTRKRFNEKKEDS